MCISAMCKEKVQNVWKDGGVNSNEISSSWREGCIEGKTGNDETQVDGHLSTWNKEETG